MKNNEEFVAVLGALLLFVFLCVAMWEVADATPNPGLVSDDAGDDDSARGQ